MAWTTPIDRVFNQKVLFLAFVGIIVGTTAVTLLSDSKIGNSDILKGTLLDASTQGKSSFPPVTWFSLQIPRTGRFMNSKVGCGRSTLCHVNGGLIVEGYTF